MSFSPDTKHSINPLFWQKGDSHEAIGEEMERMKSVRINDIIVESRPHPDYLGQGWWDDLDFIFGKADELDMDVWIFDDGRFPSGTAGGRIAKEYPEYTKRYLTERHIDVIGPRPEAHFIVGGWIEPDEELFRVVAAKRTDMDFRLDSDSLTDLTAKVAGGRLYWSVPEGDWRIFIIKISPSGFGGEQATRDYVDPINRKAVGKYVELVHEAHYAHFPERFGKRFKGFFTDEPRFGNITGYDRVMGSDMPLPYTDGLEDMLSASPLGDFSCFIPLLWYPDEQKKCSDARFVYMDTVSRLFGECFMGQVGDWCRSHGVEMIGHVVEENGAHSRIGYGPGHYFRAIKGLDAAGIDVVCNLMPERTDGFFTTLFNNYDCDFNHWGLAKMASSAAHADEKKRGRTLCEAFGAYGWSEGLTTMKWITDNLAVRGVNIITPHAFSPAPYPDPDCPPHFYARGNNPLFRYFHVWSEYAVRLCALSTDALHIAPAAVVYHAESEWAGECEPFEKAVKALAKRQIDCDVVCIDDLLSAKAEKGLLRLGHETFKVLIVPYTEFILPAFADKLREFTAAGLPVIFTKELPGRCVFGGKFDLPAAKAVPTEKLADEVSKYAEAVCHTEEPDLIVTHYRKGKTDTFLFVNQSVRRTVDTVVTLPDIRNAVIYDPMTDASFAAEQNGSKVRLVLEPWQSLCVVFGCETEGLPAWKPEPPADEYLTLSDGFDISVADARSYPEFKLTAFSEVGDLSRPEYLPDFSGTVRYEKTFTADTRKGLIIDLGEVREAVTVTLNGEKIGEFICPPYRAVIPEKAVRVGENKLSIEVTGTLINSLFSDPFSRYFPQDPTGLVDPVRILKIKE